MMLEINLNKAFMLMDEGQVIYASAKNEDNLELVITKAMKDCFVSKSIIDKRVKESNTRTTIDILKNRKLFIVPSNASKSEDSLEAGPAPYSKSFNPPHRSGDKSCFRLREFHQTPLYYNVTKTVTNYYFVENKTN